MRHLKIKSLNFFYCFRLEQRVFYLDRSFNLKQKKREFSQILTVDKNGNMTAKNLPVRRLWRVGYCHQEGEGRPGNSGQIYYLIWERERSGWWLIYKYLPEVLWFNWNTETKSRQWESKQHFIKQRDANRGSLGLLYNSQFPSGSDTVLPSD